MINFRYHVVSLVAVFLALAVGMIIGSAVISDVTINRLERDLRDFRNSNSRLRAQSDALEEKVGSYERFGQAILPRFMTGRLQGRSAVLLVQDGVPGEVVAAVGDALALSGAAKPARVRLSGGWTLADDESRGRLIVAAGLEAGDQRSVLEAAGGALGARLAGSGNPDSAADLLARLDGAGFLKVEDAVPGAFPAAGSVLIVVPSGVRAGTPRQDLFYPSLLRAVAGKRPVAVVEPLGSEESLAGRVLGDAALSLTVATVDHGDTSAGMLSLVWALRDMLDGKGAAHYGVRRGAGGVVPDLAA